MAATAWTRPEVEAVVADYIAMLVEYHAGGRVNKAAHNRALQRLLGVRSPSAIEFKHQNISAVLAEDGLDYLDGYLPAYNYQQLLREVVRGQLESRPAVKALIERAVAGEVVAGAKAPAVPKLVAAPRRMTRAVRERYVQVPRPRITDFDQIEAANRSLGLAGELAVLEFEHRRLWVAGARTLANRIEHKSKVRGDGAGYDIASFEESGRERLIEVKTTRRAQLTPFHVTRNEVEVSRRNESSYHLYRLFRFDREPKLFIMPGSLERTCRLHPTAYCAYVA